MKVTIALITFVSAVRFCRTRSPVITNSLSVTTTAATTTAGTTKTATTTAATTAEAKTATIPKTAPTPAQFDLLQASQNKALNTHSLQQGQLTFYDPTTGGGACDGIKHSNNDMIVAMSTSVLKGQNLCGKTIEIHAASGKKVKASVVDECAESDGCVPGTVDSTKGLWSALGVDTNIGRLAIKWTVV